MEHVELQLRPINETTCAGVFDGENGVLIEMPGLAKEHKLLEKDNPKLQSYLTKPQQSHLKPMTLVDAEASYAKEAEQKRIVRALQKTRETQQDKERRRLQQRIRKQRSRLKKKFGDEFVGALVSAELGSLMDNNDELNQELAVKQTQGVFDVDTLGATQANESTNAAHLTTSNDSADAINGCFIDDEMYPILKRRIQGRERSQRFRERRRAARNQATVEDFTSCSSYEQYDKDLNIEKTAVPNVNLPSKVNKESTSTKTETPEQIERRKLMARLRARRARAKQKSLEARAFENNLDWDGSSSDCEMHVNNFWIDTDAATEKLTQDSSYVELGLPEMQSDPLKKEVNELSIDEDPLQCSVVIKAEPSDALDEQLQDADAFISDFVQVEMRRIKQANEIGSEDDYNDDEAEEDSAQNFMQALEAERVRIERARQRQIAATQTDIKPKDSLFDTARIDGYSGATTTTSSNCSTDANVCGSRLRPSSTAAERMRRHRANKRTKETTEEVMKRREGQRLRAERARLKKRALQAGVLEESDGDLNPKTQKVSGRMTRAKTKLNKFPPNSRGDFKPTVNDDLQASVLLSCDSINERKSRMRDDNSLSTTEASEIRKSTAVQARERRALETPEQTEARRLKQRIQKMKSRLSAQLGISEDQLLQERERRTNEMRLMRQKQRETETPEQAAARKQRQSLQARKSRSRLEAAETPEETAARKAATRAAVRQRCLEMKQKETPEERVSRKEKERYYRERMKQSKTATTDETTEHSSVVINPNTTTNSNQLSPIVALSKPNSSTTEQTDLYHSMDII